MSSIAGKITKFNKKEIDYLFQHSRRVFKSSELTILSCGRQLLFGRVLIVTSRKVGNAPERNKIRRRIKSIFYEEKLFNSLVDCVIIVRKEAVRLTFNQLKDILISVYFSSSFMCESDVVF